jgi:hypothetical protein
VSGRGILAVVLAASLSAAHVSRASAATEAEISGRVVISPITVVLDVSPTTVRVGDRVSARATVANIGAQRLGRITVRLRLASGILIRGAKAPTIRSLAPTASATVSWSLCGRAPGSYVVFAEATIGSMIVASPARLLIVRAGSGKCGSSR